LLDAGRLSGGAGEDGAPLTLESLLGEATAADDVDGGHPDDRPVATTVTGRPRALAAAVRDRVCAMVGLQPRSYYRLLALNRLAPAARPLGRGLTENQLRPIVGLPPGDQPEIIAFAVKRGLSAKEIGSLAQVARGGDRDAVRRVMARLAREDEPRPRTTVSWEPLLHAVPRDLWRRCQSLRTELDALPAPQRRARLDAMWEQDHLLGALREEFGQIFAAHGYAGPTTLVPDDAT
jgi:hypothetical protein